MTYIINGDTVTADRYDRDRNDNCNVGIAFTEVYDEATNIMTMTYRED